MTYNTGTTPKALQQMSGNDSLALATPLLSTALQKQDLSIWLCCYKLLLDEWPLGCDTFMHLRHKSRRKAASCLRCRADLYRASSMAEQSRAGQGRAGQGRAGQGGAGQGRAGLPMLYMEKGIQFANLQHIDLQLQQGTLCPA